MMYSEYISYAGIAESNQMGSEIDFPRGNAEMAPASREIWGNLREPTRPKLWKASLSQYSQLSQG